MLHFSLFLTVFICSISDHQLRDSRDNLAEYQFNHYIKLESYTNDVQGFFPYIRDIKRIFKFRKYDLDIANKMVESIKNAYNGLKRNKTTDDVTVVSIHVRLTDYKRHLKLLFNLEPIKSTWFTIAMEYFSNKYQV